MPEPPEPPWATQIPVLLYHHLTPSADGKNGAIISVAEFEAQMTYLHQQGYRTITTAELADWLDGSIELPERSVLITFDDGYHSNYTYAYPILKRYRQRAVIFMVSGLAGQTLGALEYLSWADLRDMQASGLVEVQSHTHDGHFKVENQAILTRWSAAEVKADLAATRRRFAENQIRPFHSFAYPYGLYTAETREILAGEGVRTSFTIAHGYVTRRSQPLTLPRLIVYPGISLCHFGALLTGDAPNCK